MGLFTQKNESHGEKMSGEKTTPKSPEYKKTIDTTGFGLTCVTEYGFDNDGLFHHEYAYTHENRKAVI